MEKEGLKRCLDHLESNNLAVEYIVTDRHPQIQKFLRERNIEQFYDVWHFEKGIYPYMFEWKNTKSETLSFVQIFLCFTMQFILSF